MKKQYQIHLKSHSGPIYVLLVNKDTEATSPVVVQVLFKSFFVTIV